MMAPQLVLTAEDAQDLEVISARLQDAVGKVKDFAFLGRRRRFAAVLNRFKWEKAERGRRGGNVRVRAGLHFDGVLSVKSTGLRSDAPEAVVELLAISFVPRGNDDPAGTVALLFAGGGAIKLEVECIDAGLADIGTEWAARGRPSHDEV